MSPAGDASLAVDAYLDELLAPAPATPSPAAAPPPAASVVALPLPAPAPVVPAPGPAPAHVAAVAAVPRANPSPPAEAAADAARPAPPGRWLRLSIDRDHYAIELLRVQEVVRVAPVMAVRGAAPSVLGVMNLRGRIVPVFDFGRWLDVGAIAADEHSRIVVVERDDELVGLLVSRVDDVFTLAPEDAEPPYDAGPRKRRAMDRALLGIARPGRVPTVLLDANALFE
ncbi:hypothetical protein GCM10028862_20290 [Luteimonas pelagia]